MDLPVDDLSIVAVAAVIRETGLSGLSISGIRIADARLSLVAAIVALCVLPVLLFGKPVAMPHLTAAPAASESGAVAARRQPRSTVARMWLARLLVQIYQAIGPAATLTGEAAKWSRRSTSRPPRKSHPPGTGLASSRCRPRQANPRRGLRRNSRCANWVTGSRLRRCRIWM